MTEGGTINSDFMDVVVARQLNIPVWEIDTVPMIAYELYWSTYLAEKRIDQKTALMGAGL